MDRIISFWKILDFSCTFNYSIKCLGSKAYKIKANPNDKNNVVFLCNDKTIRI